LIDHLGSHATIRHLGGISRVTFALADMLDPSGHTIVAWEGFRPLTRRSWADRASLFGSLQSSGAGRLCKGNQIDAIKGFDPTRLDP
jgi:hypothetical protein